MRLSPSELSAMRLDGEVVPLGDSYVHTTSLTTPVARVTSLSLSLPQTHVLAGRAAAWVHGCAAQPRMLDVLIRAHVRPVRRTDPRLRIRREDLHMEDDSLCIGGMRVLTRQKTAEVLRENPLCDTDDEWSADQLLFEAGATMSFSRA